MALLVLLLSAFLYVRFNKESASSVVKAQVSAPEVQPPKADPPAEEEKKEEEKEEAEQEKKEEQPVPGGDEWDGHVEAARKAVKEKRWADAEKALALARKIRDDDLLKPLDEAVAEGRRAEEAHRKRTAAFAGLRPDVEGDLEKNRWNAALARLEAFVKEHPGAEGDGGYTRLLRKVRESRSDALVAYEGCLAEARRLMEKKDSSGALKAAQKALLVYPERTKEVGALRAEISRKMASSPMVRIPDAECWIGDDAHRDEKPLRKVRLKPFFMDTYEVTNGEYYAFILATGHRAPPHWPGGQPRRGRERHPVVNVAYEDALAYAKWAGKRLPTAEEWEVAARGPDRRAYPWGEGFTAKGGGYVANSIEYWQANPTLPPGTTPVNAFDTSNGASPFGVQGMAGNVWEWTSTDVKRKRDGKEIRFRILKGGAFTTGKQALRCSNVLPEDPALRHPDVGFRCVRDIP
jgi:formylglycine-generating enzyme required for sulfatase activity